MTGARTTNVVTFGCRLNAYESELIRQHATDHGLDDNTVIVNTCAVTGEAVRQARQTIRRKRRENPAAKIIVTGCAAQIEPSTFEAMAEVDGVWGNEEKLDPKTYGRALGVQDTERVRVNDIMSVTETAGHLLNGRGLDGFGDRARAFVQIQNGCDHRCTFCVIPFGRGNSRSVPAGVVVDQIKRLVDVGYCEVVLTGVDITAYGADLPGSPSLGRLVTQIITQVADLPRLRLSSLDSVEVDPQLFDVIATEQRVMPHLHLSLQSGDDMILKRMKRRHTRNQSLAFCDAVRRARPDVVFGADLIAGFPTETEEMFQNSLRLIDELPLVHCHIFPYSVRPGTPAARMPQVQGNVIRERAARLRAAGAAQKKRHLASLVGTTVSVLAENDHAGHTPTFAPVDFDSPVLPGEIFDCAITKVDQDRLQGVPIL